MKSIKRTTAILLSFCMLFLLCACGTGSDSADTTASTEATQPGPLNGKKIIFIGNSHTYVGNVVTQVTNTNYQQSYRDNNMGLFYLLCKQQGSDVSVTNWTFSGHSLTSLFRTPCAKKGDCQGVNHQDCLTDRYFDYVVIQPGVGTNSETNIAEDIDYIVEFFQKENPNVQFVLLGNASVYGNNETGETYPGITSYYKTLAEKGFIMADWGKLVNDLIHGIVTPEGSTVTYSKSSFIIKDGFHPNYLCGCIASVMTYCAITGTPASSIPGNLYMDSSLSISLDSHLSRCYDNPDYETNCKTILTTQSEMEGIFLLIDKYLAEKPYLEN